MELKNIAILGARGNVGGAIINELLKDGARFNITAITRPTSVYTVPEGTNISVKTADYDSWSSLTEAFAGQDAVVNCVSGGATQYDPSKLIIDAAIAAEVNFFFANEYVGDVKSDIFRELPESFAGAKVRIREYLEGLGQEGKIKWTSLNGGPFFDMWLMKGPAGFDIPNRQARIYGSGNTQLTWTPLSTIALAAANMLRNPDPVVNRPIHIHTVPNLTQNSLLSALETVLNTKFTVEHINVEKIYNNAHIALDRGDVQKARKGLTVGHQFHTDRASDFLPLVENETVGVKPTSIEDAIRDAIQRWGEDCPVVEGMFKVDACEV